MAREDAREMTLVDEAALERDGRERWAMLAEQHLRALDAGLNQPSVGWHARRLSERARKMAG